MERQRLFLSKSLIVASVAVAVLAAGHSWWLTACGRMLVNVQPPAKADIAVVLAGDYYGHRILKGAELVRQGYVAHALVSGPEGAYGHHECDLAVAFAVQHGYPKEWFIAFPHAANSTGEEAQVIVPELRRRGVHSFLLITSNFHTARAGRIFRRHTAGLEMRVVEAPDEWFRLEDWWKNRQGRKIFYFEWSKTVASALGM